MRRSYEFDKIEVGETVTREAGTPVDVNRIRAALSQYAKRSGRKFRTRNRPGCRMIIKRVA